MDEINDKLINVKKLILTGSAGLKPKPSFLNYLKIKKYKWLKKKNKFEKLARYGSNDFKALDNLMRKSFVKIVNTHQDNFVKKIKVPTLIIYGKNDKETPVYMAKKFNKLIKNSKLCLLKDSGHFCFVQKPEAFYDLIIHFLTD